MKTITSLLAAAGIAAALGTSAFAAQPIEGNWTTATGARALIAPCGGAFCITLKSGAHAGKRIGRVSGSGNSYSGTITDPADDKEYSGSAKVNGSSMKMKGCVLKVLCKSQTWKKQ